MTCPRCKQNQLTIEQAPDSFYKRVYCLACKYAEPLKWFNKKTNKLI